MTSEMPKLYSGLANWFHLLTCPEDYAEEAEFYRKAIQSACAEPPHTLLELGSGGGNNASHLKAHFQLTLVELSPEMIALSRTINPECKHLQGDMRTVRLERQFDAVFIQDAISYMTSAADLKQAFETAYVHCRPGGAALFAPDFIRETFRPGTEHGGHDGEHRALRYLEWVWDPDPNDTTYLCDFAYLLRDETGRVWAEYDRHVNGFFPRAQWLELMEQAGFKASSMPFEHSEVEPGTTEVFIGKKPV
jgi:ubiquinone/menaquinone biosynthesis C-methylase UbiE